MKEQIDPGRAEVQKGRQQAMNLPQFEHKGGVKKQMVCSNYVHVHCERRGYYQHKVRPRYHWDAVEHVHG